MAPLLCIHIVTARFRATAFGRPRGGWGRRPRMPFARGTHISQGKLAESGMSERSTSAFHTPIQVASCALINPECVG